MGIFGLRYTIILKRASFAHALRKKINILIEILSFKMWIVFKALELLQNVWRIKNSIPVQIAFLLPFLYPHVYHRNQTYILNTIQLKGTM